MMGQMGQMIHGKGSGSGAVVMGRVALGRPAEPGDVLVAKMTDPSLLDQMLRSVAVVTDEGGLFCHAALICQDLGLPFVVGTKEATTVLVDGQFVSVDPVAGTVEVMD